MHKRPGRKNYRHNKKLLAPHTEQDYTSAQIADIAKCSKSIIDFSKHFYIIHPDKGKIKIPLYKFQKRLLKKLGGHRYVSVLQGRQSGKTTTMTIYALWIACFQEYKNIVIIANKEATAKKILKRIKLAFEELPLYLKPGVTAWGETMAEFDNGSTISACTTSASSARGDTINVLIIDEMAFIPDHIAREFWESVFPTISIGESQRCFIVSTANGDDNLFYELYHLGLEDPSSGWISERVDYWEVPGRDEAWKERMIKVMNSVDAFDQEFGNKFHAKGKKVINDDMIRFWKDNCVTDPLNDDEYYKIYRNPNPKSIYAIGVDTSEGIGRNNSSAQILDITNPRKIIQCAVYARNDIEPFHFAKELNTIAGPWGNPPMIIESNNCGRQVLDALHFTHNYPRIVRYSPRHNIIEKNRSTNRLGIFSHTNVKYDAVSNMRYWINSIQSLVLHDMETIEEFETYMEHSSLRFKKKSDKVKDDRVEGLMWALFMLDEDCGRDFIDFIKMDDQGRALIIRSKYVSDLKRKLETEMNKYGWEGSYQLWGNPNVEHPMIIGGGVSLSEQQLDMASLIDDGWELF